MTETFTLYGDKLAIDYNDTRHTYRLRDTGYGIADLRAACMLPLEVDLDDVIPSATGIVDLLDKSNGLVPWAVSETINYIRTKIQPGKSYDEVDLAGIFRGAAKARYQKKDRAGDIGTLVHNWISDHILGKNPKEPTSNLLRGCIEAFLAWEKENEVRWVCTERKCYSATMHYAGTLDGIAYVRDIPTLVDFKTSKDIYPAHRAQTAAYKQAVFEEISYAGSILDINGNSFSDGLQNRIILHIKKDVGTTLPDITNDVDNPEHFIRELNLFLGLRFAKWGRDGN